MDHIRTGIELTPTPRTQSIPLGIQAAGTAGAILGIIEAWLEIDPLPAPEEAAKSMWQIIGRGL